MSTDVNPAEIGGQSEQNPMFILLLEGSSVPTCFEILKGKARNSSFLYSKQHVLRIFAWATLTTKANT